MYKERRILFLTLRVFSATGGIEKVCRILGKALADLSVSERFDFSIFSSHDNKKDGFDKVYFPAIFFKGFSNNRFRFIVSAIVKGIRSDIIILSHINLLPVVWVIKKLSPSKRVILFAHGIEIWDLPLGIKKKFIGCCDEILCVSRFTKQKIEELGIVDNAKCKVLNNCLDPFLKPIAASQNKTLLREKYGFREKDKILFTLTRMEASERYKGYDKVMKVLVELKDEFPDIKYVIAGSSEPHEKAYIANLISELNIENHIILPGFINDNDLQDYFAISDLYVMPSYNEGFGIVFIEAMFYGLPVIAGNKDGSADALLNGALGILVNPLNLEEIKNAIKLVLANPQNSKPDYDLLMEHFSYENYRKKISTLLLN